MQDIFEDNLLIVCPQEEKLKLLKQATTSNTLYNIKFMTKEEYKQNYYFSYDEKTLCYLLENYHYHIDVCKMYLENLYFIDLEKKYCNKKLHFLQELKKELKTAGLLIENPSFHQWLSSKKIIVKNYYDLDLYEEQMLNTKPSFHNEQFSLKRKVTEYSTMEEEINGTCLKIIELLNQGIDINQIYLTNVTKDYTYLLKKIFSYYHIPLYLEPKDSIFSTQVVQDYLQDKKLDLENPQKKGINRKLLSVIEKLSTIDSNTDAYQILLQEQLKNTYIPYPKKKNAVQVKDLYKEEFLDSEYVFVLGLNQDILPKMEKDIAFISDIEKEEVPLYSTKEKNKRNKQLLFHILSSIKNLFLSYKRSSYSQTFYPASVISEFQLEVETPTNDLYQYSDIYNKIRLAEKLDLYDLYGEKEDALTTLYTHYSIPYKTYTNKFLGISNDTYLEQLPYPLKLSYTSLNAYEECPFKYYIKYVLKLDSFQDHFSNFIGSMYHEILSLYQKSGFDFETEYQKYIEKKELSFKEKLLLRKIKRELIDLLKRLQEQQKLTNFQQAYFEQKIEIPLKAKVAVLFTGYIDKIMYYQKIEDTYFAIVDYKSGLIDTHMEPMKYGLHMQLPVYLYLIHYSNVFKNPIFAGIYYQNILFPYPTWDKKDLEIRKEERLRLQGYTTDNIDILEKFDSTFKESKYIKSMSYQENKGFGTYSKVLSSDRVYQLITYTKNIIEKAKDQIINASFSITPKIYAKKNLSCEYCPFQDVCYKKESDFIYLDYVSDWSFLGGEEK